MTINIFYLDANPLECAKQHCDKHVVKMIVETAQLLSTAHRILDGRQDVEDGKKIWRHPVRSYDERLYRASHINHPSAVWIRQSEDQYMYLYNLFNELSSEYTHRYGKIHSSFQKLYLFLNVCPKKIWNVKGFVEPPQCMPQHYQEDSAIEGYRNYYIGEKLDFIRYTKRKAPEWLRWYLDCYHKDTKVVYESIY
jgi:hypothetical protein